MRQKVLLLVAGSSPPCQFTLVAEPSQGADKPEHKIRHWW
jgi:hypothetical protein